MTNNAGETQTKEMGILKSIVFTFAQLGGNLPNMIFTGWIMMFYTEAEKGQKALISFAAMGTILAAGKVVDALYDPTIGYWSDNTRSKMGRRRPFIIYGTPIYVLSFILLFKPFFAAGSTALLVMTIILNTVFWLSFTTVMGPYNALMPELAESSKQRVLLSTLLAVMVLVATGYQGVLVPFMVDNWHLGYFNTVVVSGLLSFVFIMITAFTVREKMQDAGEQALAHENKHSIKDAFVWTFTNRPFQVYITASVFQYLGFASLTSAIPFIVTVLMGKDKGFVGIVYAFNIPAFIISFFIVNIVAKKIGKVKLYKFCLFLLALLLPLLWFVGDSRIPISPVLAGILLMMLLSFPLSGNMVLPTAILADIIDYDEKRTGQRREAIYFGMQGLLQKIANALSLLIMGLLFQYMGAAKSWHLGISLLGPVAGVLGLIGFIVFLTFPLDEKTKDLKVRA